MAVDQKQMFQLLDSQEALKLDVYPRELIPGELDSPGNWVCRICWMKRWPKRMS